MALSERANALLRTGQMVSTDKLPYAVLSCPYKDEFGRYVGGTGSCPHRRHASFEDAADCAAAIHEEFVAKYGANPNGYMTIQIVQPQKMHWRRVWKHQRSVHG